MKEYKLSRINETMRGISIVLIMPFVFGILATVHLWNNYPLYGKLGLAFVVLSLLAMIICYRRTYEKFIIRTSVDTLTISNAKCKNEKKIDIQDIAFIQYTKSVNAVEVFLRKQPYNEDIAIISKTGKTFFFCSNNYNFTEFHNFFNDIRNLINAKERLIYAKQTRMKMAMTKIYKYFYINPLHENTSLLKKKTKQAGFYYWMIWIALIIAILIISWNLFNIYKHGGFQN